MSELSAFERSLEAAGARRKSPKMPAPRTFMLKPEHFADTWVNKPIDGILIGIRVPSEKDVQGARRHAEKVAREAAVDDEAERVDIFNDTLMSAAVASAMCDPNDVTSAHPVFDMPDDEVPLAFTSRTIKFIFDFTEILHIEQSPVFPEATPEDETKLVDILCRESPYDGVSEIDAMKARRLLRCALDLLEG